MTAFDGRRGRATRACRGQLSRWTGIPVDKMLEGERDKLLHMEEAIGQRVIGQGRGGHGGVANCGAPLARRACRTRTGRWARSCSSARPGSARPN